MGCDPGKQGRFIHEERQKFEGTMAKWSGAENRVSNENK